MGKSAEARKILGEIEKGKGGIYGSTAYAAAAYGWLGDKDKAFNLLEKAFAERDARMIFLKVEPWFDSLRSDPRFSDLLRRIGLEK